MKQCKPFLGNGEHNGQQGCFFICSPAAHTSWVKDRQTAVSAWNWHEMLVKLAQKPVGSGQAQPFSDPGAPSLGHFVGFH